MRLMTGDLFTSTTGAIGHGVNTRGAMGAGIAVIFKRKYPAMYEEYHDLCRRGELRPGEVFPWRDPNTGLWVYNIASQDRPGPDARLEWLSTGASAALEHAAANDIKTIALPRIGCGIGGLVYEDVEWALRQVERNRESGFEIWTPDE